MPAVAFRGLAQDVGAERHGVTFPTISNYMLMNSMVCEQEKGCNINPNCILMNQVPSAGRECPLWHSAGWHKVSGAERHGGAFPTISSCMLMNSNDGEKL